MDAYFEDFRLNVKYYRDKRRMTQAELAVQADCSNGLIGNIEAGNTHPSFDTIVALATVLGVTTTGCGCLSRSGQAQGFAGCFY